MYNVNKVNRMTLKYRITVMFSLDSLNEIKVLGNKKYIRSHPSTNSTESGTTKRDFLFQREVDTTLSTHLFHIRRVSKAPELCRDL